jgi:adenosylmethionine-8-amino-7-oxononanoate aminotransferase
VREICDRHGILMVADEVMAGFGRTGKWFETDHWDAVPDLMTMAKGLTSSYRAMTRSTCTTSEATRASSSRSSARRSCLTSGSAGTSVAAST